MVPVELYTHEWLPPRTPSGTRTAVLVHGLKGWHRTWWRVGPALAALGWRVIAVDQLGHGHSPRIRGAAGVEDFSAALEHTVRERLTEPIDLLVGHSLGGVVSMSLAHRAPDLVRRLVLEDPPSLDRSGDEAFLTRVVADVRAARERPEGEIRRERAENPRWQPEDVRQDVEGCALTDAEGMVATLRQPRGFNVVDRARELPMPVLWILADEERSVLVGEARERLRRTLPATARLIEMDGGHTVHRDRFEEWMDAVTAWLAV